MSRPDTLRPPSEQADPIADFSQCHAGILGQLAELDELPALLAPAARARAIAARAQDFFQKVVLGHHGEEEEQLFPAVLASAQPGTERERVREMAVRLTAEHREVEAAFRRLEPQLRDVARGRSTELDAQQLGSVVQRYVAHARYEEQQFLPLAHAILSRNGDHLAALALSLHLRHHDAELHGLVQGFHV